MPHGRNRPRLSLKVALLLGALAAPPPTQGEAPYGLPKRIPWDNSRLSGSPEPPLPYTVEKTYTRHSWRSPIYVAGEPGTDRLWVVQAGNEADKSSQVV